MKDTFAVVNGVVAVVTGASRGAGRAIATLAADPAAIRKAGELLTVEELARDYGFTDVDCTQPEAWRV